MDTKRWDIAEDKQLKEASEFIQKGEVVSFPTETVYGLGADATNQAAVAKIFTAKGRPQDNPLIAHVTTKEQLKEYVKDIPPKIEALIEAFSPGPITYVLPHNGKFAKNVTAGLDTVGVRIPAHPVARTFINICGVPLAAPSANISGKPSPTKADHVWHDLQGEISGVIDGGLTGVGLESTVIDGTKDIPVILRPGGVSQEEIEAVIGKVDVSSAIEKGGPVEDKPHAPGMKYKHYQPDVPLWLVYYDVADTQRVINRLQIEGKKVGIMGSLEFAMRLAADMVVPLGSIEKPEQIAAHLYDGLRTFDPEKCDIILCEAFAKRGLGVAIMNRLEKAATHTLE